MNKPDYENNLYFEPEMTWEDLCKWVGKNPQYDLELSEDNDTLSIWNVDGIIEFHEGGVITADYDGTLAKDRTPKQMKTIIENMLGENK